MTPGAGYMEALSGLPDRHDQELLILLYHGVTEAVSEGIENASCKHISADAFYRQMAYVAENCTILSLPDIVALHETGQPYPPRSLAITFDDGFRNNFTVAAPILSKLKIPATFYICAGIVDTGLMFWVDELEDCFNRSTASEIQLSLNGTAQDFSLDGHGQRLAALNAVKSFCKQADAQTRERIVQLVVDQTGVTPDCAAAANYEKITWRELREMASDDLFTIGGHTLYHDIMTSQPEERMQLDLAATLELLDYNLDQTTGHFSYPEGQPEHYNAAVIDALKRRDVICCPSAICGLNPRNVDLFNLRRVMPGFLGMPFPLLGYNEAITP
jgi:peptidoglycan/xylan/chitin deacetylase (PgdA/CDA1 family)